MHDPVFGRWWVTDPASQFINPYLPLAKIPTVFVDPDAEYVLGSIVGFVGGLFKAICSGVLEFWNADKGYVRDAWAGFGQSVRNGIKIDMGLWNGNFGQVLSRLTWDLPQTVVGYTGSAFRNGLQGVKSVNYDDGATAVESYSSRGGVTLGSFVNGCRGLTAAPSYRLFQHEYGHYIQSQKFGLFFLNKIGIPSLFSIGDHNFHPVEQDVNFRAYKYFSNKLGENGVVWYMDINPIRDMNYKFGMTFFDYVSGGFLPLNPINAVPNFIFLNNKNK